MFQSIIEFLNLKEDEILSINTYSTKECFFIELSLKVKPHPCPNCGFITSKTHRYYLRSINHGIFLNRKCVIHYNQRRFICTICKSTFTENFALAAKYQKKTLASHLFIMELAKDPHCTFKSIAKTLYLSTPTVISHFYKSLPVFKPTLPEVLCIDEVYLGRKFSKKYATHILDFKTDKTVEIIYGRTKGVFMSYFQKIPKIQRNIVKFICSDMYSGFRNLQSIHFPSAKLCIDSFHVIKLINDMFNSIIKSLLRSYHNSSIEYYLLKHCRFVLLKNSNKIDWFESRYDRKLGYHTNPLHYRELLFNLNPLIKDIYNLKEDYITLNRLKDIFVIPDKFNIIVHRFCSYSHKDVRKVGRTLSKWEPEILNSFIWFNGRRISNGPIESRNNTIKLLIRNAAGYSNFEHLRLRSIYCVNHSKKER